MIKDSLIKYTKKIDVAPLPDILPPLFKTKSINLQVKRFFTDVDGQIIDKGSVASNWQRDYPVYMLGDFDRVGGFNLSQSTLHQPNGIKFLMTYVHGLQQPFLYSSGFNTVQLNFKLGDVITIFTDSFDAPTGYVWIQQTALSGALSSIISNIEQHIHVKNISLQVDSTDQLEFDWQEVNFMPSGIYQSSPLILAEFRQPNFKLTDYILIKKDFKLTRFKGFNFLFSFSSNYMNINFRIHE